MTITLGSFTHSALKALLREDYLARYQHVELHYSVDDVFPEGAANEVLCADLKGLQPCS